MRYPDGTYDLTIDDIHEIREETSKMFEMMSNEEIIVFLNEESRKFNERKNNLLQLAWCRPKMWC